MNFKKLIKIALVGLGIVFFSLIAWNWEEFKEGWDGAECCPKTEEK